MQIQSGVPLLSKHETSSGFEPSRQGPRPSPGLKPSSNTPRYASSRVMLDLYCMAEIATVALIGFIIARTYVGGVLGVDTYLDRYLWPTLALPLVMALIQYRSRLYEVPSITGFVDKLGAVASGIAGAFGVLALVGIIFGISGDYSRVWFGGWLAASLVVIWLMRAIAAGVFSRWLKTGAMRRRAAIFGGALAADAFAERIGPDNLHIEVVGVFGRPGFGRNDRSLGTLDDMIRLGRQSAFDMVIVAPPYENPAELDDLLDAVSMLSVEIKLIPPSGLSYVPLIGISEQGQHRFIDIQRTRISDWGRMFKLIEDYVIAATALVLLSWLLLLIAAAIRLESKGPALFRQKRTGLNNSEFEIYKFRTMTTEPRPGGLKQVERGDRRVTRIGRFLRRTSLDELPQLLNVLRGEMSIVGPRPHPIELNHAYEPRVHLFNKRHSVKPGITGWAQIHDHRGPIETLVGMHERLKYDLYYIDNWSIWFDLKIIAATPLMSLMHRNAI